MLEVNYIAILVAALSNMVIGFLWYSTSLFGKAWMKEVGKTETDLKKGAKPSLYLLVTIGSLIEAYVLANFLAFAGANDIVSAKTVAFMAWAGFVATAMWANYSFAGKSTRLYMIDVFYHLATLLSMSVILTLLG